MLREALLGLMLGTFTGITPGIHVNTLASLLRGFGLSAVVLFAMGLTHTFLDVVPSTFLGVPDEGTALGVLPAHRLVLSGRGLEVVRIALIASFLAVLFFLPLVPLYLLLAPLYRPAFGKLVVLLLTLLLVFTERGVKKVYALFIILLSGILGLFILSLPLNEPFYALFTGLFGVPVIVSSLLAGTKRIEPGSPELEIAPKRFVIFSFMGTLFGMLASLLPAFTASQAALLGSFISRDERSFLTIVYSVNTANFLFALLNFLETGRERNGVVTLMEPLSVKALPAFLLVALFVGFAVLLYGEHLARLLAKALLRLPYRFINLTVLTFLILLALLFDGISGLLALTASSIVGYLAVILGVKRTNCMGSLMLPALLIR
ncbi:tripartite tricarboxylate transporter permease [Thermococcus sp.]|uniref:tripartite tricarboxylate transporter permease n=1 Tax=Thermococcus sp. TaxID=35749 RepID=UPI002620DC1A|nr:tripartite tricarboxylate transporter permease [Thermococcus sp.]